MNSKEDAGFVINQKLTKEQAERAPMPKKGEWEHKVRNSIALCQHLIHRALGDGHVH